MESLVRISVQSNEQVTSIARFKLGLINTLFFAGGKAAHTLEGLPGLWVGVVYRSYNKQQIIEYLQWDNLAAFEASVQSAASKAATVRSSAAKRPWRPRRARLYSWTMPAPAPTSSNRC